MQFKLAQCLCPKRHCVLASMATGDDAAIQADLQKEVSGRIKLKWMRPWCAICGAKQDTWSIEIGVMKANSASEAFDELVKSQRQQMVTRAHLMATGQAYDSPLRN